MIGLCILVAMILFYIASVIWYARPYKALTWLFHDIFGWHVPGDKLWYGDFAVHSYCRICGREIIQDSQGNWFEH